ncbi:hypothetical protein [Microbulbifer aggregans]|uniref:hypothetical protein n=1 Tax=Microbulbifer aggregans TaxID=1769779 RepID=UPI001CFDA0BE|nr:hypothetical protein [Microbulbifer aggregans]
MHDKKNCRWICPDTGTEYDLSHMADMTLSFNVMLKKGEEPVSFPCRVEFHNHCYTRGRKEGDTDEQVFIAEKRRGGEIEERVFCPERWDYSLRLPEILRNIVFKDCLQGDRKEILFRQEDRPDASSLKGWYLCMRFDYRKDLDPKLILRINSCHWRPNRPDGVRGGPKRFLMLLAQFLRKRL